MRRLGEVLVSQGLLTEEELDSALTDQMSTALPLGEIVVGRDWVSRPGLLRALAAQRNRELEFESGFGSGLFGLLAERHELRRASQLSTQAA